MESWRDFFGIISPMFGHPRLRMFSVCIRLQLRLATTRLAQVCVSQPFLLLHRFVAAMLTSEVLGLLFPFFSLSDYLPLLSCGHLQFGGLDFVTRFAHSVQTKVACFRTTGLRTPLSSAIIVPSVTLLLEDSFQTVRCRIMDVWNVDVVAAEILDVDVLVRLNAGDLPTQAGQLRALAADDSWAAAFILAAPQPVDSSKALAGSGYCFVWLTFRQVAYILTYVYSGSEPSRSASFSCHAGFTGPFQFFDSEVLFDLVEKCPWDYSFDSQRCLAFMSSRCFHARHVRFSFSGFCFLILRKSRLVKYYNLPGPFTHPNKRPVFFFCPKKESRRLDSNNGAGV